MYSYEDIICGARIKFRNPTKKKWEPSIPRWGVVRSITSSVIRLDTTSVRFPDVLAVQNPEDAWDFLCTPTRVISTPFGIMVTEGAVRISRTLSTKGLIRTVQSGKVRSRELTWQEGCILTDLCVRNHLGTGTAQHHFLGEELVKKSQYVLFASEPPLPDVEFDGTHYRIDSQKLDQHDKSLINLAGLTPIWGSL